MKYKLSISIILASVLVLMFAGVDAQQGQGGRHVSAQFPKPVNLLQTVSSYCEPDMKRELAE